MHNEGVDVKRSKEKHILMLMSVKFMFAKSLYVYSIKVARVEFNLKIQHTVPSYNIFYKIVTNLFELRPIFPLGSA